MVNMGKCMSPSQVHGAWQCQDGERQAGTAVHGVVPRQRLSNGLDTRPGNAGICFRATRSLVLELIPKSILWGSCDFSLLEAYAKHSNFFLLKGMDVLLIQVVYEFPVGNLFV